VKDQLEGPRQFRWSSAGILFDEAVGRIRKAVHQARSGTARTATSPRAAEILGIPPQYLEPPRIDEYKLDSNGYRRRTRLTDLGLPARSEKRLPGMAGEPFSWNHVRDREV